MNLSEWTGVMLETSKMDACLLIDILYTNWASHNPPIEDGDCPIGKQKDKKLVITAHAPYEGHSTGSRN